jgi:hypothetical protein
VLVGYAHSHGCETPCTRDHGQFGMRVLRYVASPSVPAGSSLDIVVLRLVDGNRPYSICPDRLKGCYVRVPTGCGSKRGVFLLVFRSEGHDNWQRQVLGFGLC